MKTLLAAAALSVLAAGAMAGEGQGNPFPYQAPTQTYSMQGYKQVPGTPQNPYPFSAPPTRINAESILHPVGAAAEVQSANSLPVGFNDPDPVRTARAASPTRYAQPATPAYHGG